MKNESVQQTNRKPTAHAPRLAALTSLIAGALLLTSCPTGVDWSDYDGVNLISDRPLGSTDAEGNSLWYFAEGLNQHTDPDAPYDYVELEEVSSDVYGALPAGVSSAVYRLEVVNLLSDGTFEDSGATVDVVDGHDGASGWSEQGSGFVDATIVDSSSSAPLDSAITGKSLFLNFEDAEQRYAIDLSQPTAILDGGVSPGDAYAFAFDFKTPIQSVGIELNNNVDVGSVDAAYSISRGDPIREDLVYSYPPTNGENTSTVDSVADGTNVISIEPGLTWFSFGGIDQTVQLDRIQAVIDNLRFVRADQNHLLRLPVTFGSPDRPIIRSGGSYTIRMWVRNDPTSSSSEAPNRLRARFLSAGIDPRVNEAVPVTKTRSTGDSQRQFIGDLTDWEELSFSVDGSRIQTDTSMNTDTVIFDLTLEIGDSSSAAFRDAGSVLITDVSLEWSPSPIP